MELDWQQLILQLGIAGAMLFVVYRVAVLLIEKWAVAEAGRTKAMSESEAARTKSVTEGFKAITDAHERIVDTMNNHQTNELTILNLHAQQLATLTARIDTALDLTPVRGTPRMEQVAKVIVSAELEEKTPVDAPQPRPTPTPRAASSPGVYGPMIPKKA